MLTVHHLENSRSQRILWLLEELGIDYEIKLYKRDPKTSLAPLDLKKIHPLGKSPVVTDGDDTVAESANIIEYVLDKYGNGRFRPEQGTDAYQQYRYWMHYSEGTLGTLIILKLFVGRIETAKMPFFAKPIANKIAGQIRNAYLDHTLDNNLAFIEAELGKSDYFVGDSLTGADFQMSFAMDALELRTDLTNFPNMRAYIDRIRSTDSWKRGIEKGGPYELMGGK